MLKKLREKKGKTDHIVIHLLILKVNPHLGVNINSDAKLSNPKINITVHEKDKIYHFNYYTINIL